MVGASGGVLERIAFSRSLEPSFEALRAALELEPAEGRVIAALAELLATDCRGEEALALLEKVPETAETRRIAALARTGPDAGEDIETRLAALLDRARQLQLANLEAIFAS